MQRYGAKNCFPLGFFIDGAGLTKNDTILCIFVFCLHGPCQEQCCWSCFRYNRLLVIVCKWPGDMGQQQPQVLCTLRRICSGAVPGPAQTALVQLRLQRHAYGCVGHRLPHLVVSRPMQHMREQSRPTQNPNHPNQDKPSQTETNQTKTTQSSPADSKCKRCSTCVCSLAMESGGSQQRNPECGPYMTRSGNRGRLRLGDLKLLGNPCSGASAGHDLQ